jgi:hypothetical protein
MSNLDEVFKTTKFNSIKEEISNCKCQEFWTDSIPPKLIKTIKCDYCKETKKKIINKK